MSSATFQDALQLAIQHHQAGRLAEAEGFYQQVLARNPNDPAALHLLGVLAGQAGRADAGIALIRRSIAVKPDYSQAHASLAQLLIGKGQLNEGIAEYDIIVSLRPGDAVAHRVRGEALRNAGRYTDAVAAYARAIQIRPDWPLVQFEMAESLRLAGRFGEAKEWYMAAIQAKPDFVEACNNLGVMLVSQGIADEAIAAFSKAIAINPQWEVPHRNLGMLFYETARFELARAAYEQAIRCKADYLEGLVGLAKTLAELQRFAEAEEVLARAIAVAPDSPITQDARGTIFMRERQGNAAIESFRHVVELSPESATSWNSLGVALRSVGQFEEACNCFRKALSIRPDFGMAYVFLNETSVAADTAEIKRLLDLVANTGTPLDDRVAAEFSLGRFLDAADNYEGAFEHYATANGLVLRMRQAAGEGFDSVAFSGQVDQTIGMFTPEFFARTRDWGEKSELPVFIVGMPRSGTSLVEQIAASHPAVFGAGELRDIGRIAAELGSSRCEPGPVKTAAAAQLERLRSFSATASRVIDKMPANVEVLGLIAAMFPAARVIICRRDPRDTCLSCYFQWFANGNLFSFDLAECGRRHVQTDRLIAHWLKTLPLPMLEVQYETLVGDLEGQSRRIIGFLGLPWDAACLNFHRTERTVLTSSAWQVRQPIYNRSVGRWRHYQRHLGPLLAALAEPLNPR